MVIWLITALAGLIVIRGFGVFNNRIHELFASSADSLSKDSRPAFVVTKYPNRELEKLFGAAALESD